MTTALPIRFAASRWYNEPPIEAIENTEKGTVTIVVGDSSRTYPCTKTTQVYSSESKNVFLLWYPKLRKAVVIYALAGVVADHTFYTKLPLKDVDFCVNRIYATDTAGNKVTVNLGQVVTLDHSTPSSADAFKVATRYDSSVLF